MNGVEGSALGTGLLALAETAITKNLTPIDMVQAILGKGQASFSLQYRGTQLLLIRLPRDAVELAEGLSSMRVAQSNASAAARPVPVINFHTEIHSSPIAAAQRGHGGLRPGFDAFALETLLAEASHFILPIRKRPEADAPSAERISIGRARNKDIVLRHASISKFHGWLQLNENGVLCVADAGSKNRTRLNDVLIEPKALVPLHSGDRVRFGSVDAIVCTADMLWEAVHLRTTSARSTTLGG